MIQFDLETRQFSTEDRIERKYKHLRADGMTHEGAIGKLKRRSDTRLKAGLALNALDSGTGLIYNASSTKPSVGLAVANLGIHGGIGALQVRGHKKRSQAINKIDEKYRDK